MSVQFTTFIGVEACSSRTHPFTFAVIDRDLVIRSIGSGNIKDAFAFLAGQENALTAINSPMTTSQGILKREEIRKKLSPGSHLSHWANLRLVEYELLERGVQVPRTTSSRKNSPRWMRLGFQLFDEIHKLGYEKYPHMVARKQYFESQGEAVFWNLLGHSPLKKDTLEGCLQRQLILSMCGLPVPDAMRFFEEITRHRLLNNRLPLEYLYSSAELNTLAAAYTAWMAGNQPDKLESIGHEEESIIYLPKHPVNESGNESVPITTESLGQ
jgi:hypothetical protein